MPKSDPVELVSEQYNGFITALENIAQSIDAATANEGKWLGQIVGAINKNTKANYKAATAIRRSLDAGFAKVAEAIAANQPPPLPAPTIGGKLVARYKIPDDQPPIVFTLTGSGFLDSKGADAGAADIDLSVESDNPSLLAEMTPQTLSDDGKSVSTQVTLTAESPTVDFATVAYKATNRDTGNVVAADSDEFQIGPGEAAIGTLDSPVPLPEVV